MYCIVFVHSSFIISHILQMMYDLLMNYLEERGITDEFAEKLCQTCSAYEHSLYITLLEQLQTFVKRK